MEAPRELSSVLRARRGARLFFRVVRCGAIEGAAIAAFGRFGKGMGHRAQLNFGDCAVYALAALRGEPVLATGGDFKATDLMTEHVTAARG